MDEYISRHMKLPDPRGPLSAHVTAMLRSPVQRVADHPELGQHSLTDDDLHLALYLCYELHYSTLDGVDPAWEWEPSLLEFRRPLEDAFEKDLSVGIPATTGGADIASTLRALADEDSGCSLASYLETEPSIDRFREFVMHRSAYQLKEADPHSWVIPRLGGKAKAALIEIQSDEYGGGDAGAMHAVLFGNSLRALGLDDSYGAYVSRLPGVTLAGVNLMSMFGLHRRWRGAIVGHLALFEMTSTEPNRKYGNALRKLGFGRDATHFYEEHVEADAVHETIAAHDLAGSLAREEPEVAGDIEFGARCLRHLDELWCEHLVGAWADGRSSVL